MVMPWCSRPGVRLKGVGVSSFAKEMIELAWMALCKKENLDVYAHGLPACARDWFVDTSQSHSRGKYGSLSKISLTVFNAPRIYKFSEDCCLGPNHLAATMGWRHNANWKSMSSGCACQLVANSISLPVLTTVLYPLILSCPLDGMWSAEGNTDTVNITAK